MSIECEKCGEVVEALPIISDKELLEAIEKANNMISPLCMPKGSYGGREWIMSIPARPEYDPDLVISDALYKAMRFINQWRQSHDPIEER